MTLTRSLLNLLAYFANIMEAARLTYGQNSLSADRIAAARRLVLDTPAVLSSQIQRPDDVTVSSGARRAA